MNFEFLKSSEKLRNNFDFFLQKIHPWATKEMPKGKRKKRYIKLIKFQILFFNFAYIALVITKDFKQLLGRL